MLPLALCLVAFPGLSTAETAMPDVPAGLQKIETRDCEDGANHEKGQCVVEQDAAGIVYVVFKQDGIIQFIRQITPVGYVDLWMRDSFASY